MAADARPTARAPEIQRKEEKEDGGSSWKSLDTLVPIRALRSWPRMALRGWERGESITWYSRMAAAPWGLVSLCWVLVWGMVDWWTGGGFVSLLYSLLFCLRWKYPSFERNAREEKTNQEGRLID